VSACSGLLGLVPALGRVPRELPSAAIKTLKLPPRIKKTVTSTANFSTLLPGLAYDL
jgi:hypothetical protein